MNKIPPPELDDTHRQDWSVSMSLETNSPTTTKLLDTMLEGLADKDPVVTVAEAGQLVLTINQFQTTEKLAVQSSVAVLWNAIETAGVDNFKVTNMSLLAHEEVGWDDLDVEAVVNDPPELPFKDVTGHAIALEDELRQVRDIDISMFRRD